MSKINPSIAEKNWIYKQTANVAAAAMASPEATAITPSAVGANTGDQSSVTGSAGTVATNHNMTGPITGTGNVTSITAQVGTGTTFVVGAAWTAWTPVRTGWTDVGTATVAGTSYIALPVSAGSSSFGGAGIMADLTTLVSIGNAIIDTANSRCYVPAQLATGDTMTVSGWFEK